MAPKTFFYDFTEFIIKIDHLFTHTNQTLLLLRNRRMGKSLFLDSLNFYYNLDFKDNFQANFENLVVQNHSSPLKNSMYVLKLDFSTISNISFEDFNKSFNNQVNDTLVRMKQSYTKFGFAIQEDCTRSLQNLAADIKAQNFSLLILIDEYDTSLTQFFHRPEELQKFKYNSDDSIKVMSVFRNFFATLKLIVQYPKIYLFIAGVSPQSLNDFTSGFNIGYYLGEQDEYAGILGYPEEFVMKGIMWLNIPEPFQEAVLNKLKEDNNGYQYAYAPEIKSVYNPAKINYCFLMMQNKLKKDYIKNEKDLKRFMKFLFDFAKNKDSRPAGSTLDSLTLIKDVDKILFKILNNPKLCLMEKISRPSLSFWDFHKETQVISYLYYCGALTYAPYS